MNRTSRFLAGALACTAALSVLAGCSSKQTEQYDRYNYDLSQYVQLCEYKGLEIEEADIGSAEDDLENQILLARSNYAEVVEKTDAAALTDQVNIDYVGTVDGVAFEGGSDTDCDLTLGSGMLIAGFEEGLVGAKPGDIVTLNLSFPDPYTPNATLSGKAVQFQVTVNHIYEQKLPDYTDEFVKKYYGYDTVEAFEKALLESLEAQYESNRTYYRLYQVWDQLQSGSEILKYPETEYNEMYQNYVSYYTSLASEKGLSLNEYAADELGMSVSEFNDWLESEVKAYLKEEMILYAIARLEKLTVSEEEYQAGALRYAQNYGLSSVAELETYFDPANIRQNILFDKTLEYVASQATVKK